MLGHNHISCLLLEYFLESFNDESFLSFSGYGLLSKMNGSIWISLSCRYCRMELSGTFLELTHVTKIIILIFLQLIHWLIFSQKFSDVIARKKQKLQSSYSSEADSWQMNYNYSHNHSIKEYHVLIALRSLNLKYINFQWQLTLF